MIRGTNILHTSIYPSAANATTPSHFPKPAFIVFQHTIDTATPTLLLCPPYIPTPSYGSQLYVHINEYWFANPFYLGYHTFKIKGLGEYNLEYLLDVYGGGGRAEDEGCVHGPGETLGLFRYLFLLVSREGSEGIEFRAYQKWNRGL